MTFTEIFMYKFDHFIAQEGTGIGSTKCHNSKNLVAFIIYN
jgi:hypothetical protein